MRILLLTETIPYPLDTGGRIKTFHTLTALAQRHEVHCHAFIRAAEQHRFAANLRTACASVTLHLVPRSLPREARFLGRALLSGRPYTVERHFDADVFERVRSDAERLDVHALYCDHLSMLEYGRRLRRPIVHDAHNVEYQILRRYAASAGPGLRALAAAREWRALRRYERTAYRRCDLIFAVSEVDAREIRTLAGEVEVVPLPIAVDAAAITPPPLTDDPEVLFVGGLHWPPNEDAVRLLLEAVWPLVLRARPDAHLTIVGGGPHLHLPAAPRVDFAGRVPDVAPYFARARVLVVPLRSGSGMRVKILDGFARGVPVVSTSVGIEGITAEPGRHYLRGDEPARFAAQVVALLHDGDLGRRLAAAARVLVLSRYDRQEVGRALLATVERFEPRWTSRGPD